MIFTVQAKDRYIENIVKEINSKVMLPQESYTGIFVLAVNLAYKNKVSFKTLQEIYKSADKYFNKSKSKKAYPIDTDKSLYIHNTESQYKEMNEMFQKEIECKMNNSDLVDLLFYYLYNRCIINKDEMF